jgi:hypothetical protein
MVVPSEYVAAQIAAVVRGKAEYEAAQFRAMLLDALPLLGERNPYYRIGCAYLAIQERGPDDDLLANLVNLRGPDHAGRTAHVVLLNGLARANDRTLDVYVKAIVAAKRDCPGDEEVMAAAAALCCRRSDLRLLGWTLGSHRPAHQERS